MTQTLRLTDISGFGFDFEAVKSEDQRIAATYRFLFQPSPMVRVMVLLGYICPPMKALPLRANRELEQARRTLEDTALSMIRLKQSEEKDKEGRGERDILGVMIEENRQSRENGMSMDALSEEEMVNQIMTFLAAGYTIRSSY